MPSRTIPSTPFLSSRCRLSALLALAVLTACAGDSRVPAPRLAGRLWQKGSFQTFYGADGRIERLLQDADGDGRADAVILYDQRGRPQRSELDTDRDGTVDRWEELRPDGSVASVAYSVRHPGRPDLWEYAGPDGRVVRREIDDDGDGQADRVETAR